MSGVTSPLRVLIAEDHDDLRRMLSAVVSAEPDMTCVAAVGSTEQVVRAARESRPDVAVLDLSLDDGSSLHLIRELRAAAPGMKIMMYSGHCSDATVRESLRRGAHAYVVKSDDSAVLLAKIRSLGAARA